MPAGHWLREALVLASDGANVVVSDLGSAVDGPGASASLVDGVVPDIREPRGELVTDYAIAPCVKVQAVATMDTIRSIRLGDVLCCLRHRSQCSGADVLFFGNWSSGR